MSYLEVPNNAGSNRCEKCTFSDKLEYCETGKAVPRGCHKRNTYWIVTEETISKLEEEINTVSDEIIQNRENATSTENYLIKKVWKLRNKVTKLRGTLV